MQYVCVTWPLCMVTVTIYWDAPDFTPKVRWLAGTMEIYDKSQLMGLLHNSALCLHLVGEQGLDWTTPDCWIFMRNYCEVAYYPCYCHSVSGHRSRDRNILRTGCVEVGHYGYRSGHMIPVTLHHMISIHYISDATREVINVIYPTNKKSLFLDSACHLSSKTNGDFVKNGVMISVMWDCIWAKIYVFKTLAENGIPDWINLTIIPISADTVSRSILVYDVIYIWYLGSLRNEQFMYGSNDFLPIQKQLTLW